MKTELRLRLQPHSEIAGANVVEVWYDGEFIATVTGADGPGVRIISKHPLGPIAHANSNRGVLEAVEVAIHPGE